MESPSGAGMNSGFFPENTRLGRYRIVKRLGGGETSEVLLAVSHGPHGFERIVVLKRLLPKYEWDASIGRMLATEAVAYARLTHPAIVRLYDFFDQDGHAVLVMEYVDGVSLGELQNVLQTRNEALSDPAAFYIASRLFAGLAAAHAARDPRSGEFAPVVHRDVSPGSLLLPWDGFVKLGDFGFAKVKGLTGETSDTRHGVLKGTIGYMAPEQVLGERVTPRTDVYAGCLLLRELLTATPTFPRGMPELDLLHAMAEAKLAPVETLRSGISPRLADAMRRGLARDPEARTLTAAEMGRVLRQETDLAFAQVALVDLLSTLRPTEIRASTPPAGSHAFGEPTPSGTMRFERLHLPPEAMPSDARASSASESDSHPTLRYETPAAVIVLGSVAPSTVTGPPPVVKRRPSNLVVATGLVGVAACVALGVFLRNGSSSLPPGEEPGAVLPAATQIVSAPATEEAVAPSVERPAPTPAPLPLPISPPPSPLPSFTAAKPLEPAAPPPAPASSVSTMGDLVTPASAHSHRVFVDGHYAAPRSGATLSLRCGTHTVRVGSKGKDQTVHVPCGGSVSIEAW
jgi:serine/threonine protein kinase